MWTEIVVAGCAAGTLLGWEASTFKGDTRYRHSKEGSTKLIALAMLGVGIALYAESVRGFLVVYLSGLGAYYLAKPLGELAQKLWYRWRDPHPIVEGLRHHDDGKQIDFYLRSKCTSPLKVDTVFLRGSGNKVIPIDLATIFQESASLTLMVGFVYKGMRFDPAG